MPNPLKDESFKDFLTNEDFLKLAKKFSNNKTTEPEKLIGKATYVATDKTIDITNKLNNLNISRAITANIYGKEILGLFAPYFPWDIKNSADPDLGGGKNNRNYKSYIYNGNLIRYDAPGNINYGFVAKSLGLSDLTIQAGAAIEQFGHDLFKENSLSLSDNKGDLEYVQMGIDLFSPQDSCTNSNGSW